MSNKIIALILNKDDKAKFHNVIVYNETAEGYLDKLFIIPPKYPIYIALLYPLYFPYNIIGWYYKRYLYIDPEFTYIYKALIM